VAIAFVLLALTTYGSEARSSFVQEHGRRVSGRVQSFDSQPICDPSPQGGTCYPSTRMAIRLSVPVGGVRVVHTSEARSLHLGSGRHVQVLLDPADPSYAELAGQPRTSGGIWIVAALLAAASIALVLIDGRSVLRRTARRRRHPTRFRQEPT